MTDDEFIEASVAHQMGSFSGLTLTNAGAAKQHAVSASTKHALFWNAETRLVEQANGRYFDIEQADAEEIVAMRSKDFRSLKQLLAAGVNFDCLVDMEDRRVRALATETKEVLPVFSFHRLDDLHDRILWPRVDYQDNGSDAFLGGLNPNAVAWKDKLGKFAWRGGFAGRSSPHFDARREGHRMGALLRQYHDEIRSLEDTLTILMTFPRHRFVSSYIDHPRADVGFVGKKRFFIRNEPLFSNLQRPPISRPDFQAFKYLVVLPGMDIGSSFYWTMNSGSLGLVMENPYHSFASVHFKPWVHYVPFRADLSDFEDRLSWCEEHQDECEEMTMAAGEVCRYLAREDLRTVIGKTLIKRVRELIV